MLIQHFFVQVRGILAQLGFQKLDDVIGRTDILRPRDISLVKTQHLDLSYILSVRVKKLLTFTTKCAYISYFLAHLDLIFAVISRVLACQSGAVLRSGIKMYILMVLFWMIPYLQILR